MVSIVICTCLVVWGGACLVILRQFIIGGSVSLHPPQSFLLSLTVGVWVSIGVPGSGNRREHGFPQLGWPFHARHNHTSPADPGETHFYLVKRFAILGLAISGFLGLWRYCEWVFLTC